MEALQSDFQTLLKLGHNFQPVRRFPVKEAKAAIQLYENEGLPVIIEGFHHEKHWPKEMFTPNWLTEHGPQKIHVRNVYNKLDTKIPIQEFLEKSRNLPMMPPPDEKERLYGKDVECPMKWNEWLHKKGVIPATLLPESSENMMLQLPKEHRVETLMCYLGISGTYTSCHKDLCASSGQNLMCYTEKDGSSLWTMTASSDAPRVSKYFHSMNHEIDHENHLITMQELAAATRFTVYLAEQKLGDLILVPPRSCHQVVNKGGLTIKTSWSRMTLKGLEVAYYHELPIYRRVCRPEIYRVKLTIYHNLLLAMKQVKTHLSGSNADKPGPARHRKLEKLLHLFEDILIDEHTPKHGGFRCLVSNSDRDKTRNNQNIAETIAPLHCDFCHGDIFQSFFECRRCVNTAGDRASLSDEDDEDSDLESTSSIIEDKVAPGEGFAVCAGCFVEGRRCDCSNMEPIQCRPFSQLLTIREEARSLLDKCTKETTNTTKFPPALGVFHAACLQQARFAKEDIQRTCSSLGDKTNKHDIWEHQGCYCKQCHRTMCYEHYLLKYKLHVVDILLLSDEDPEHNILHREHRTSLQRYNTANNGYLETQRRGTKPDMEHQRIHLALEYPSCKPLNPQFATLGWYDKRPVERQATHIVDDDIEPTIAEATTSSSKPASTSQGRKRNRQVLDCVDLSESSNKKKSKKLPESRIRDSMLGEGSSKVQAGISNMRVNNLVRPRLHVTVPADSGDSSRRARSRSRAMAPFTEPSLAKRHPLAKSSSDSRSNSTLVTSREVSLSPLTPMSLATPQDNGGLSGVMNHALTSNHQALDNISLSSSQEPQAMVIVDDPVQTHLPFRIQRKEDPSSSIKALEKTVQEQAEKLRKQDSLIRNQQETIDQQRLDLADKEKQMGDLRNSALCVLSALHLPTAPDLALYGITSGALATQLKELIGHAKAPTNQPNPASQHSSSSQSVRRSRKAATPALSRPKPVETPAIQGDDVVEVESISKSASAATLTSRTSSTSSAEVFILEKSDTDKTASFIKQRKYGKKGKR